MTTVSVNQSGGEPVSRLQMAAVRRGGACQLQQQQKQTGCHQVIPSSCRRRKSELSTELSSVADPSGVSSTPKVRRIMFHEYKGPNEGAAVTPAATCSHDSVATGRCAAGACDESAARSHVERARCCDQSVEPRVTSTEAEYGRCGGAGGSIVSEHSMTMDEIDDRGTSSDLCQASTGSAPPESTVCGARFADAWVLPPCVSPPLESDRFQNTVAVHGQQNDAEAGHPMVETGANVQSPAQIWQHCRQELDEVDLSSSPDSDGVCYSGDRFAWRPRSVDSYSDRRAADAKFPISGNDSIRCELGGGAASFALRSHVELQVSESKSGFGGEIELRHCDMVKTGADRRLTVTENGSGNMAAWMTSSNATSDGSNCGLDAAAWTQLGNDVAR
jgi:hypothetical protein